MAVDRFYTKPPQAVDGSVAFAVDVNGVNDEADLGFKGVASELDGQIAAVSSWTLLAKQWAENPEDTQVTVGNYSSLHWAAKAAADAVLTAADRVQTGLDASATAADRVATGLDASATAADRVQTGLDLIATNQDTIDTAADLVATNQDTIDTAADAVATAADRVQTGLDRTATGLDASATGADRVQTGLDRVAVADLYDSFDDRYLGAKASDPTLDNDGNALATVALYFNTTAGEMRVYNSSSWQTAYSYTTPKPFDDMPILAQIQATALSF